MGSQGAEKLKRIVWRLRSLDQSRNRFTAKELKTAIFLEIGQDHRTYLKYRKILKFLDFIKFDDNYIILTGHDLEV